MRQVCQLCALEDYVEFFQVEGELHLLDYVCRGPHCKGWSCRVAVPKTSPTPRSGIAEEYGVYDDLLECISPDDPWLEYGIIEYRYARLRPDIYLNVFMPRWGHTVQGPRNYSLSSFLGTILGALSRSGDLHYDYRKATGYWSYNGKVGYVTKSLAPAETGELTWAEFAVNEGLDPKKWVLPTLKI